MEKRLEQGLTLALLLGYGALPIMPSAGLYALAVGSVLAFGLALALGLALLLGVASFVALAALLFTIPGFGATWPAPLLVALALWIPLVRVLGARGKLASSWLTRGESDAVSRRYAFVFVLLASVALLGWFLLFKPDVSDISARLPKWPWYALLPLGMAFSFANAFAEELVYRGVMQGALTSLWQVAWLACVLQALAFGLAHLNGFPRGAVGVGLATIYGLMTGYLRLRTKGLRLPILMHVAADITIFAIILSLAR